MVRIPVDHLQILIVYTGFLSELSFEEQSLKCAVKLNDP